MPVSTKVKQPGPTVGGEGGTGGPWAPLYEREAELGDRASLRQARQLAASMPSRRR